MKKLFLIPLLIAGAAQAAPIDNIKANCLQRYDAVQALLDRIGGERMPQALKDYKLCRCIQADASRAAVEGANPQMCKAPQ
jgi:hypothetical protein